MASATALSVSYPPSPSLQDLPPLFPVRAPSPYYRPYSVNSSRSVTHQSFHSADIPVFTSMGFGFKDKERTRKVSLKPSHGYPDGEHPPSQHGRFMGALKLKRKRSLGPFLSLTQDATNTLPFPMEIRDPFVNSVHSSEKESETYTLAVKPKLTSELSQDLEDNGDEWGYATDKFIEKDIWIKRHDMKLHPYQQDAPYMQGYDPILLENDRFTDILLRRLNPSSPSFYNYGKVPPATVLDLGCGPGYWVVDAATAWKSRGTQVTGFDLVDVTQGVWPEDKGIADNIKLIRGNFLKYKLPFADHSFELVRMANLSLSIPYDKWEFIFREAYRVLTKGGRLELIDDQIFFPYGCPPSPQTPSRSFSDKSSASLSSFDLDDDNDDLLEEEKDEFFDAASTLVSEPDTLVDEPDTPTTSSKDNLDYPLHKSEAFGPPKDLEITLDDDPVTEGPSPYPTPITAQTDTLVHDSSNTWEHHSKASKELETVFEEMLNKKFGIHTRPSNFILDSMKRVFGNSNASKLRSMHLKLAPPDLNDGERDSDETSTRSEDPGNVGKKAWISIEWDKKEKKGDKKNDKPDNKEFSIGDGFINPLYPGNVSPKAAGRLGIAYTPGTLYQQSESFSSLSFPRSSQSPGLLLWPYTFMPLSPSELEMHACKHMHVLLGSKPALAEYVAGFKDEHGGRVVSEDEFKDALWEYECFRRRRFNWPSEVPEFRLEQDLSNEVNMSAKTSYNNPSFPSHDFPNSRNGASVPTSSLRIQYSRDELTHARTIRVYQAIKRSDSDALLA